MGWVAMKTTMSDSMASIDGQVSELGMFGVRTLSGFEVAIAGLRGFK